MRKTLTKMKMSTTKAGEIVELTEGIFRRDFSDFGGQIFTSLELLSKSATSYKFYLAAKF